MGITIDYKSLAPVDQATKTLIDEDCEFIRISFDWWFEPSTSFINSMKMAGWKTLLRSF